MSASGARLGLTVPEVAALLGVAPSTVYRWETTVPDPRSRALLEALEEVARRADAADVGARVRRALRLHGQLAALYALLDCLYGPCVLTRPGACSGQSSPMPSSAKRMWSGSACTE